jgi:hypothetical protein
VLIHPAWQTKVAQRLGRTETDVRVQIARDMIDRIRELTRTITRLYEQLAGSSNRSRRNCWQNEAWVCSSPPS